MRIASPHCALLVASVIVAPSASAQAIHKIPREPTPPSSSAPAAGVLSGPGAPALAGTVIDSLAHAPVAGATVRIAGTSYQTTTDDAGRFRFDSLPEGRVSVIFSAPALDSLGITPAPREVEIRRGSGTFVELAGPSAETLRARLCGTTTARDGQGTVLGVVRDADSGAPVPRATVVFYWSDLEASTTGVRRTPRAVSAPTDERGAYHACGVGTDTRVTAQARSGAQASGWIELQLSQGDMVRRDLSVGSPTVAAAPAAGTAGATPPSAAGQGSGRGAPATPGRARTGNARIAGRVTLADGRPAVGAQVHVLGAGGVQTTDDKGAFVLAGLPSGTRTLEVRMIGYEPTRYIVDLSSVRETRVAAVLDKEATMLDTVRIAGRASRDVTGFEERRRRGFGQFLTREQIQERAVIGTTDALRGVPGVRVEFDGNNYQVRMNRAQLGRDCPPAIYMDGLQLLAGSGDLDNIVRPEEIEGIEVYASAAEVPPQYQGPNAGCGVILIWTRTGANRSKR